MKLSAEYRDRPMSPLDTAIFWTEYVVRHGGTNIRSPAIDLTWWQIALLDVYGILLAVSSIVVYLLFLIVRKTIKLVIGSQIRVSDKKNK